MLSLFLTIAAAIGVAVALRNPLRSHPAYVHVVLVRRRPNPDALDMVLQSTLVYGALVAVYVLARVARWLCDRRTRAVKTAPACDDQPVMAAM